MRSERVMEGRFAEYLVIMDLETHVRAGLMEVDDWDLEFQLDMIADANEAERDEEQYEGDF